MRYAQRRRCAPAPIEKVIATPGEKARATEPALRGAL